MRKQAVVIIHGIGEQKPMDTLRNFVHNLKDFMANKSPDEKKTVIRSKPDLMSDINETRCLSLSSTRRRPMTDFYEYYWAHNMRDSTLLDGFKWLYKLLTGGLSTIPKRLVKIYWTFWALILLLIIVSAVLYFTNFIDYLQKASYLAYPLIVFLFSFIFKYYFNYYLADAARYFSPLPNNIVQRNKIKNEGLKLLTKLTANNSYQRIIVVGHSLGSAIGYDIINLLWHKNHKNFEKVEDVNQSALKEINDSAKESHNINNVDEFQEKQYNAWEEYREMNKKWKISDFVSCGAVITNADFLAIKNMPFSELIEERELSSCPPQTDDVTGDIYYNSRSYQVNGKKRTVKILNSSSLFALTRWTNIYFDADYVGGSGQRLFGKGIKDIKIENKSLWFIPKGHTEYWDISNDKAMQAIFDALKL